MMKYVAAAALALCASATVTAARAEGTVECHSRNYQYGECWAGPLKQPQLVHQISGVACIVNRTWGYNPASKYIWVAQGCSGVFADVSGYHHGRGDTFDPGARHYDHHGHDIGSVVAGVVIGALVDGMTQGSSHHQHTTSNYRDAGGYNGCHGIGCAVDDPDEVVDSRPQFDSRGEPNFDVHGNYQGCHGIGCLADDPDE